MEQQRYVRLLQLESFIRQIEADKLIANTHGSYRVPAACISPEQARSSIRPVRMTLAEAKDERERLLRHERMSLPEWTARVDTALGEAEGFNDV